MKKWKTRELNPGSHPRLSSVLSIAPLWLEELERHAFFATINIVQYLAVDISCCCCWVLLKKTCLSSTLAMDEADDLLINQVDDDLESASHNGTRCASANGQVPSLSRTKQKHKCWTLCGQIFADQGLFKVWLNERLHVDAIIKLKESAKLNRSNSDDSFFVWFNYASKRM